MAQQQDVMDAVQRERHKAYDYGYLRTGPQVLVTPGPYIAIAPVNPAFYFVPAYDPLIVFGPPRPGFFVGGAIRFGGGITIGAAFAPWGWGHASFGWGTHTVIINNHPWARTWDSAAGLRASLRRAALCPAASRRTSRSARPRGRAPAVVLHSSRRPVML